MEVEARVKATFRLGSETHTVEANKGRSISEELVSFKEKSMSVLKEYITKHNVPNDVPDDDDLVESSSEDDEQVPANTKSKKTKLT